MISSLMLSARSPCLICGYDYPGLLASFSKVSKTGAGLGLSNMRCVKRMVVRPSAGSLCHLLPKPPDQPMVPDFLEVCVKRRKTGLRPCGHRPSQRSSCQDFEYRSSIRHAMSGLLLPFLDRPDLDLRRHGHRIGAALHPGNRLLHGRQLPDPVASDEIAGEWSVCDRARATIESYALALAARTQPVAVFQNAVLL